MTDTSNLYQEMILDHAKNPVARKVLENPTHEAVGHNPLCGDKLILQLTVENNIVKDIGFRGEGCAISTASTSLMNQAIQGKNLSDVHSLVHKFIYMLTENNSPPEKKLVGQPIFNSAFGAGPQGGVQGLHDITVQPKVDGVVDNLPLGKLAILGGVKEYPMRVKCATLPFRTLEAALAKKTDAVKTE
jgi:nitrogen fixation NifU-like protein